MHIACKVVLLSFKSTHSDICTLLHSIHGGKKKLSKPLECKATVVWHHPVMILLAHSEGTSKMQHTFSVLWFLKLCVARRCVIIFNSTKWESKFSTLMTYFSMCCLGWFTMFLFHCNFRVFRLTSTTFLWKPHYYRCSWCLQMVKLLFLVKT